MAAYRASQKLTLHARTPGEATFVPDPPKAAPTMNGHRRDP